MTDEELFIECLEDASRDAEIVARFNAANGAHLTAPIPLLQLRSRMDQPASVATQCADNQECDDTLLFIAFVHMHIFPALLRAQRRHVQRYAGARRGLPLGMDGLEQGAEELLEYPQFPSAVRVGRDRTTGDTRGPSSDSSKGDKHDGHTPSRGSWIGSAMARLRALTRSVRAPASRIESPQSSLAGGSGSTNGVTRTVRLTIER